MEALVAMAMLGILGTTLLSFLTMQGGTLTEKTAVFQARQDARAGLSRITADIRLSGRGLNRYDIEVPDLIVPNDGSVSVNTFTSDKISVLAVPDPNDPGAVITMDPAIAWNGDVDSSRVVADPAADLSALAAGTRMIFFDPNSGNSQVVSLTGLTADTLFFITDSLDFDFPEAGANPTQLLRLNQVRYRVNTSLSTPFLERQVDNGAWLRYMEGISALTFEYFDDTQNPFMPNPVPMTPTTQVQRRAIRWMRVTITATAIRATGDGRQPTVALASIVVPRNMLPGP